MRSLPFVVVPAALFVLVSCQSRAPSGSGPTAQQAVTDSGAPPRLACDTSCAGGGSAMPLDEFDPLLDGGGWMTLTCGGGTCCPDGEPCDITDALQQAIDTLVSNTSTLRSNPASGVLPTVLYIPPGHYTIHRTIEVSGAIGGAIVGDDPDTTTITWAGAVPGSPGSPMGFPMVLIRNSHGTKFARITLDGGPAGHPPSAAGCTGDPDSPCGKFRGCPGGMPWLSGISIAQQLGQGFSVYFLDIDDDVFRNLSFGIMTFPGASDFATTDQFINDPTCYEFDVDGASATNVGNIDVRRSSFENISVKGISLEGQNTLVWLVEDNAFINCHRGVGLDPNTSASLVNNLFFNNDTDDSVNILAWSGNANNVFRGNVSVGAKMFYLGFADVADFSGNYVALDPTTQHCFAFKGYAEQMMLLDNYISGPANGPGITCTLDATPFACTNPNARYAAVGLQSGIVTHGHNAYTGAADRFVVSPNFGNSGSALQERCVGGDAGCPGAGQSADRFGGTSGGPAIPAAALHAFQGWGSPALGMPAASVQRPTIAPRVGRIVKSVATDASACTIAPGTGCGAALDQILRDWAAAPGAQYLLYFPGRFYYIDRPVTVPAGLDVVIAGDGGVTHVVWTGTAQDASIFTALAPSRAMFRDLYLYADGVASRPTGILVNSRDDTGGMVYIDLGGGEMTRSSLEVAGLDNVQVRAEQYGLSQERGVDVLGGGRGSHGSGQTQGVFLLSGGGASLSSLVTLRNWGKAVLVGSDNEDTQGITLDQSGYLTMDSGRLITGAVPAAYRSYFPLQPNVAVASTFRGNVTVASMSNQAGVAAAGARQAQVLLVNNNTAGPLLAEQPAAPTCPASPSFSCSALATVPRTSCPLMTPAAGGAPQMALANAVTTCLLDGAPTNNFVAGWFCDDDANSATDKNAFLDTMLSDLRTAPSAAPICATACGQTAVRIHNVGFIGGDGFVPGGIPPTSAFLRSGIRVQRSN